MAHAATLKAIADITDAGLFERLATSILREAEPQYEALIHSGVNTDGKTIKSPVDGLTFISKDQVPHMVSVHHTTGDRDKLERKWLHNPATVKRRKKDTKSEGPGDVLKTIQLYEPERIRTPGLTGTLVLTVTSDPQEALVRQTEAVARHAGLTIDWWAASRIADFLDLKPAGQWLRYLYLGIEQELLSRELLHDLARKNLDAHSSTILSDDPGLWVDRELDRDISRSRRKPLSLVVGEHLYKCTLT